MTQVKICGIRRHEDIFFANECKPDYIGFIFAPSKRKITYETAQALSVSLHSSIKKVGVFVNEFLDQVMEAVDICSLDIVQLHGEENQTYIDELKRRLRLYENEKMQDKTVGVWKAIRVKCEADVASLKEYKVDAFVLDTYIDGEYGGSGKTFDWSLASRAKKYGVIYLAGGLCKENVEEAIALVAPEGVDVSSGVEIEGIKDIRKMKEFVVTARNVNNI